MSSLWPEAQQVFAIPKGASPIFKLSRGAKMKQFSCLSRDGQEKCLEMLLVEAHIDMRNWNNN